MSLFFANSNYLVNILLFRDICFQLHLLYTIVSVIKVTHVHNEVFLITLVFIVIKPRKIEHLTCKCLIKYKKHK